jgi:methanogenesis marker radical SAM protein
VKEYYSGFKELRAVADETLSQLQMVTDDVSRISISGGGDPSCYPRFTDLIELLSSMEAPLHIGYTSGKGFDDPDVADFLIDHGLTEVSFTIVSVNPRLRKRYMHDPSPDVSLRIIERLAGEIDVYAAAVVLPGINDGEELERTCEWLQERGAKGLILMRFANTRSQGLILGNAPIIKGQQVQTPDAFRDLITGFAGRYSMKISGTPLWDPAIGSPFAILREPELLEKLPRLSGSASLISGKIAAPYIRQVIDACGKTVHVAEVDKEVACLITREDLEEIDPAGLQKLVVLPGRAFVHDREAHKILSRDGVDRLVMRGPDMLTADAETSMGMTRNEVLFLEMEAFSELIQLINRFGAGD